METDYGRAKRLGFEIEKIDRLSNLPDCLVSQVLLNLPTKDVVNCGVLASRWKHLWKNVPGLDLDFGDFPDLNAFASFVDKFLGFYNGSCLENFKLEFNWDEDDDCPDTAHITPWIKTVVRRKVKHLHILDNTWDAVGEVEMVEIPKTVYTCKSLVSLKLCNVILANPNLVSLPCLKVMDLDRVQFANSLAYEMLISGCSILESLTLCMACFDAKVLRVSSQSLLSFTHSFICVDGFEEEEDLFVSIDAPRLEYLEIAYPYILEIKNPGTLVKVNLHTSFNPSGDPNDLPKDMIGNFLLVISNVKHMEISSHTLEMMYHYSRCQRMPLFRKLYSLIVYFDDYSWEMLSILLESCPNLKSLEVGFGRNRSTNEGVSILTRPPHLLPSLEHVKIIDLRTDETTVMELVSYFLENLTILKRFTVRLYDDDLTEKEKSVILEKLLTIPRRSRLCQIVVL